MRRTVQSVRQGVRSGLWSGSKCTNLTPFDPIISQMESIRKRYTNLDNQSRDYPFIHLFPENPGFIIPFTKNELGEELSKVPVSFLKGLKAVFTLGGSEKILKAWKKYCHGYYWNNWIYLVAYPKQWMDWEWASNPFSPNQLIVYTRAGVKVQEMKGGGIRRIFDQQSLKKFYLQDVLMHEIGHHNDSDLKNSSYQKKEGFAQWFATEYGYRLSKMD